MTTTASIDARGRILAKVRLHRRPVTWTGVLLILAGAMVVALPEIGSLIVGAVAGWLLWLVGAAMLLVSFLVMTGRSLWAGVLTSVVAVAGGALLFFNPGAGAVAAALLIAAVLMLDGACELALALDLRPIGVWRWVLASSIASGLAGVGLLARVGGVGDLNGIFLGLALASTGATLLALARPVRRPSLRGGHSGGVRASPRTPSI